MDDEHQGPAGRIPSEGGAASEPEGSQDFHNLGQGKFASGGLEAKVDTLVKTIRDLIARTPEASSAGKGGLYRDLAAIAEDFIFVIDLEGKVDYINQAASSLLAVAPEQLLGRPFDRLGLLPDPEEAEELLAQVIIEEGVVRYERAVSLSTGTRHLYTTLSPMRDVDGGITGILGIAKDVSELARARDELRSLTLVDELTGVYNRRGFTSLAAQHLSLAQRNGSRVCLIMADMDGLKDINDRFGHQEGDEALSTLAAVLKDNCRQSDLVARIGGDEFVLLTPGIAEGSSAALVSRLQRAVEAENQRGHRAYRFSASIGAVECRPGPSCSVERLLEEADKKMYEVKRARAS